MHMRGWSTIAWWVVGLGAVGALFFVALRPVPVEVDVAQVAQGPMVVTVDDEGETRIRRRFIVSSPVTGRLQRIELEPGDTVTRGETVVARVQAEAPPLLDARTRAEAEAARASATALLGQARAEEQRANSALDLARRELAREQELASAELTTRQAVDLRESAVLAAEEAARAATFAVATAAAELQRAEARLEPNRSDTGDRVVAVLAPIDGVVLRRLRESAAFVPAGQPLIEIGDPQDLEVVSDLLSTDAVRVRPGSTVRLEQWGGDQTLTATVRRVEPSGFMKMSALGVEEQRVNVLMDFDDADTASTLLGDGYRAEVRIVTWEADDVVQVPTSALFRQGDAWAVYVLDGSSVRLTTLTIDHRNSQSAEVLQGVSPGDEVVIHPPDTLADGVRVDVPEGPDQMSPTTATTSAPAP
jgi:HlyD family secretion protein